jgi:hypothetical protein
MANSLTRRAFSALLRAGVRDPSVRSVAAAIPKIDSIFRAVEASPRFILRRANSTGSFSHHTAEEQDLPTLASLLFVKSTTSALSKALYQGNADAVVLDMEVCVQ